MFFLLVFLGIFSSFIGTLAGGGGLITLPAMMLFGIPIHNGIATNKFSSGIAALTSVTYLLRNRQIKLKVMILYVTIAFLGGVSGALITTRISDKNMNVIALILLFMAFVIMIKNKKWISKKEENIDLDHKTSFVIPYFVALYDGGFGPGSSTFGILLFLGKTQSYLKAVQLTRVLILGSCFGAFLVFYQTGFIQWHYAIAMAIGSAIGSQIGLIALPHIPLKVARNLLIMILVLLMGEVLFNIV